VILDGRKMTFWTACLFSPYGSLPDLFLMHGYSIATRLFDSQK